MFSAMVHRAHTHLIDSICNNSIYSMIMCYVYVDALIWCEFTH
jgi:hypothetical protein